MNIYKNVGKGLRVLIGKAIFPLFAKSGIVVGVAIALIVLAGSFSSSNLVSKNNSISNAQATTTVKSNLNGTILTDINNNKYDLKSLGKTNVLYFFDTHCVECTNEINSIIKVVPVGSESLVSLISAEDSVMIKNYIDKNKLTSSYIAAFSDLDNTVFNKLNVSKDNLRPSIFILDKNLNLQYVNFGYNTDIKDIISNIFSPFTFSTSYKFSIDQTKLVDGCSLSDSTKKYKSNATDINVINIKNNSDDLAGCINNIIPAYKSTPSSYSDTDIMFYTLVNGKYRIYPRNILIQHPYLEDNYDNLPVGILYDALTDTINVFNRFLAGTERHFIYSGRIYNNHFLLFDTDTYSLWDGRASIAGVFNNISMLQIPVRKTEYKNFKNQNNLLFLNPPLVSFDYSKDPLSDPSIQYRTSDKLIYPIQNIDARYKKKDEVIKIEDQTFLVKDLKLPLSGKTKTGMTFLITKDNLGGIAVYNRKLGDIVYSFISNADNTYSNIDSLIPKNIRYVSSKWSENLISTTGPLIKNQLKEIPIERGYWFYLSQ